MTSLDHWPGAKKRRPSRGTATYSVRAPLARWLETEARGAAQRLGRYRVLDIGCGPKPYYPYFAPHADEYVGVDIVDDPAVDLRGSVEDLPVADGSFDVVLCTQVLEHCVDPPRAVRELARVVAPGGVVLASTHGVQIYHPSPDDLWRWTHAGLERLFRENADWSALEVRAGAGTAACVAMVVCLYVELLAQRVPLVPVGRALVAGLNRAAEAIDARSTRLSEPGPGTLIANYHVTAYAPTSSPGPAGTP